MAKYIGSRVIRSLITLFIIVTVVFLLMRMMPVEGYFGEGFDKMDPIQVEAALDEMGLNDPILVQLKNFYVDLLHGDLGVSRIYRPNVPITKIILPKIPYSAAFGMAAVVIGWGLGMPLGMLMARYKGKVADNLGTGYVVLIQAVPAAVYFLFLQLYMSDIFHIPMLFDIDTPSSWILPTICMSLGGIAGHAMWTRRYMVDQLNQDYIKLAKAKGMKNSTIMYKQVIRNAFVPMAHQIPSNILFTISGSIYIESLFSIPGMGGLLITAIQQQDNALVQALVLIYSCIGIFGLLLGDLLMALCDPRIKLSKKGGSR